MLSSTNCASVVLCFFYIITSYLGVIGFIGASSSFSRRTHFTKYTREYRLQCFSAVAFCRAARGRGCDSRGCCVCISTGTECENARALVQLRAAFERTPREMKIVARLPRLRRLSSSPPRFCGDIRHPSLNARARLFAFKRHVTVAAPITGALLTRLHLLACRYRVLR